MFYDDPDNLGGSRVMAGGNARVSVAPLASILHEQQVDRDYPFQVAIVVPPGGLGTRLNELHAWALANHPNYLTRSAGRHPDQAMRWCFREEAGAAAYLFQHVAAAINPTWSPSANVIIYAGA